MTSGIYKLTFKSGAYYIGKSVDVHARWKQHFDRFDKGTAATLMQQEFDKYGYPDRELIAKCHKDHLDVMESFLISNYAATRKERILNTSFPEAVSYEDFQNIIKNQDLIQKSTIDLIVELDITRKLLKGVMAENSSLSKPETEYIRYTDDEELELEHRIASERNEILELTVQYLKDEIKHYKSLPWWRRLFK